MRPRTAKCLFVLCSMVTTWSVVAAAWAASSQGATGAPPYAKGRLIVKYKSDGLYALTACAHCLFESRTAFQSALHDRSDRLDKLHQAFKVSRITPLFRHEPRPQHRADQRVAARPEAAMELHDAWKAHTDAVKARYPRRTQRAPAQEPTPDLSHIYVIEVPPETNIEELCRLYAADPHVEYAEPDSLTTPQAVMNDPMYPQQWALQKIQIEQAWQLLPSQGQDVVVAVIDSGIDYTHPDLAANLWTNAAEKTGLSLIDDDRNGFIDDIRGWNFSTNTNDPMAGGGIDHGTHVAGIIGAVGNNGVGVVGLAPRADVMALHAIGGVSVDQQASVAAAAIRYAVDNGADVLNNSYEIHSGSATIESAIRYAHSLGVVVVFAAGNDNQDISQISPQNMPETLTVAATGPSDQRAVGNNGTVLSNFGDPIDVAAPGQSILSTVSMSNNGGYQSYTGTSMAAPHVAGLAALLIDAHPTWTNEQIRWAIRKSADDVLTPGVDIYTGAGRINAARALQTAWNDTADPNEAVWLEDSLPAGASAIGLWLWDSSTRASGSYSHKAIGQAGALTQHYFENATTPLTAYTGEALTNYVYLAPGQTPDMIMLQWRTGTDWEHRAYWGANQCPWGVSGTASRRRIGPIPPTGGWVKLEVPADLVGLAGQPIRGMAFTLYGPGTVYFDRSGKREGNNASFLSQSVGSTTLTVNTTRTVSVTMRNVGGTTWTQAAGYRLGSQNPQDNTRWGLNRVSLSGGDAILRGQNKAFTFTIRAPAKSGTYGFQWRMLQEGKEWFGPLTANVSLTVIGPTPTLSLGKSAAGPWSATTTFSSAAKDKIYLRMSGATPAKPVLFHWTNSRGVWFDPATTLTNPLTGLAYQTKSDGSLIAGPLPNGTSGVQGWTLGTNYKVQVQVDGAWSSILTYGVGS